jgi:hypothetical protein
MTDLRQLVDDVEQLREDVNYLTALLEPAINGGVAGIAGAPAPALTTPTQAEPNSAPRTTSAHVWHNLKPTEAAQAWKQLTAWVDWLLARYQVDDTVPTCWYRHGAMVEELDALRAGWNGAYLDPDARPTDPAYWHELLARGLTRIHEWDRYGCAAGAHQDDAAVTDDSDARTMRDEHIYADIDARATRRHRLPVDA